MKNRFILSSLLAAALISQPGYAQEIDYDAFGADLDEVHAALDRGFELDGTNREAAISSFTLVAKKAEAMLEEYQGLDDTDRLDLHYQAGHGWYYSAATYSRLADEAADDLQRQAHSEAMLTNLLLAESHYEQVYAYEGQRLNPAEYYFTATMLAEYGVETDDPRKVEWAALEVKAARQRVAQADRLEFMDPWSSRNELIRALVAYSRLAEDDAALEEARELFADFPEDDFNYRPLSELIG